MKLLVLSPDFASHYNPLSVLAHAAAAHGHRVIVATGEGLRRRVEADGFVRRKLTLGGYGNTGIAVLDERVDRFVSATAIGPIETIRLQAEQRQADLLWEPEAVASAVQLICDEEKPDQVLVDHISFGSTLGMLASGQPFITVVPGHPAQLPVGSERYGLPPRWPHAFANADAECGQLVEQLDRVEAAFTRQFNAVLGCLAPDRSAVANAYRVSGSRVLYNSVRALVDNDRHSLLPPDSHFVGPLVRTERLPQEHARWSVRAMGRPQVFVALGTFLSHRSDVLIRLADALRTCDVRAAIATGATDPARLGAVPDDWIIDRQLPQVAMLANSDLAMHHGGNNTVQEALVAGVRQVVLPFSTDQFSNAADLERIGAATVLAPNDSTVTATADSIVSTLARARPTALTPRSTAELVDMIFDPREIQ